MPVEKLHDMQDSVSVRRYVRDNRNDATRKAVVGSNVVAGIRSDFSGVSYSWYHDVLDNVSRNARIYFIFTHR